MLRETISQKNQRTFRIGLVLWGVLCLVCSLNRGVSSSPFDLKIEQVTFGTKHHFFGYIGQCQTLPWNAGGRYILALEIDTIDRMPRPEEAAALVLVDTLHNNTLVPVDKTHAWNPQQGPMFYWNYYTVYHRTEGAWARSEGLDKGAYSGDIRIDPAPRWNRTSDAILVPDIAENKTRQMYMIRVITRRD